MTRGPGRRRSGEETSQPKNPIKVLRVDTGQRVLLPVWLLQPVSHVLSLPEPSLTVLPFAWIVGANLPAAMETEVWAAVASVKADDLDERQWVVSPAEVLDRAPREFESARMASLIYDCELVPKTSENRDFWRLTLPPDLQAIGALPKEKEELVVVAENWLLSLWRIEAWKAQAYSLIRNPVRAQ